MERNKTSLLVALEERNQEAVEELLDLAPPLGAVRDLATSLYPFQFAAANDCSVGMIYLLLLDHPDIIRSIGC